jgi:hypothetical protein
VSRALAMLRLELAAYARQRLLLVLLVVVPLFFVTLMFAVTPAGLVPVLLIDDGRSTLRLIDMPTLHGAIMVPIAVGFLSGLVGLFLMLNSKQADARLLASGTRPWELAAARGMLLAASVAVVTAVSVLAALPAHVPGAPAGFVLANLLTGLEYGLFGVLAGAVINRLGGTYVMFFGPMVDIGLVQNPMLPRVGIDWWMRLTPGYQVTEIAVDTAFTPNVDTWGDIAAAGGWVAALALLAALTLVRVQQRAGI